jgi:hypothetical protein
MKDWDLELRTLEQQKQNEEAAARLALVADEITELAELENEFTIAGTELDQHKQTLSEVTAKNSPLITELSQRLSELKSAISEIDVGMYLQGVAINNSSLEAVKQQTLVNELAANKDNGDLEFARYMAARQTLIELERVRDTDKEKLKNLTDRFYDLKAIPDVANLDRKILELKNEALELQTRVSNVELDRRQINTRMNFLRTIIAKNTA